MKFQERKLNNIGLLPPKTGSGKMPVDKNINTGITSKFGLDRSDDLRKAKIGLKTGFKPVKKRDNLNPTGIPEMKNALGITEGAFAQIEQLLEESKRLLEELYMKRTSENGITPGSSAPQGDGKAFSGYNPQSNQLLNGYKVAVREKIDDNRQHLTRTNDDAREVDPGTGSKHASYNFLNAEARDRGSRTNAERERRLQDEYAKRQQEQEEG
jgi:hypothetical protein